MDCHGIWVQNLKIKWKAKGFSFNSAPHWEPRGPKPWKTNIRTMDFYVILGPQVRKLEKNFGGSGAPHAPAVTCSPLPGHFARFRLLPLVPARCRLLPVAPVHPCKLPRVSILNSNFLHDKTLCPKTLACLTLLGKGWAANSLIPYSSKV